MESINATQFNGTSTTAHYSNNPNKCPFCNRSITPRIYGAFLKDEFLEIVYRCPDVKCGRMFLSQYELSSSRSLYQYKTSTIGTFNERKFSENITELSKTFTEIYNQAFYAESLHLKHIAGIGYRKALEFIIKDYLVYKQPDKTDSITKKLLGKCIKDDVENLNLKEMAERATWLGNDETHYVRKWVDKDVSDLKKLIDVTLHWIDMELLTDQYKKEMNSNI